MKYLVPALIGACGAIAVLSSDPAQARETFPACGNDKVLKTLVKRFNKTEKIYWQERGLQLEQVSGPHLHNEGYLSQSPINRRYCHGTAQFENGKNRRVHYLIEEGAGFAGFGWNVEYCIHGLDPWKYNDGRCRVLSR